MAKANRNTASTTCERPPVSSQNDTPLPTSFHNSSQGVVIATLLAILLAREMTRPAPTSTTTKMTTGGGYVRRPSVGPDATLHRGKRGERFYRIDPGLLGPNPLLDLHIYDSGLSKEACSRLIRAAEAVDRWDGKSAFGKATRTEDVDLTTIAKYTDDADIVMQPFEGFIQQLGAFISETFLIQDKEKDGAELKRDGKPIGGIDYAKTVKLKGMPFVIRYDAGRASKLKMHKDNADVSFILMLSDPADFKGGGTYIEALNTTVQLQQGEALVFSGQLVHSAIAVYSGKRYVLSGFTEFSPEYFAIKRKGTLRTMPYLH